MYLSGQGESGKTEWAVKTFTGRRLVVLTPENDLAGSQRDIPRLGLESHQAQTIHHYLCINPTKPIEKWDPTRLGHRLDNLAEVIVIDECCNVPHQDPEGHTRLPGSPNMSGDLLWRPRAGSAVG